MSLPCQSKVSLELVREIKRYRTSPTHARAALIKVISSSSPNTSFVSTSESSSNSKGSQKQVNKAKSPPLVFFLFISHFRAKLGT